MTDIPAFLNDTQDALSDKGFATGKTWYHGTSSALVEAIQAEGLKRSGDRALKEAAKKTMATIGNEYTETTEPVFLTQSKALAYYWAQQTVRNRSVRIEGEELPVVFAVNLPESLNASVRPDVGAASLLMVKEGEQFMAHLTGLYQAAGLDAPSIDLKKADRMDYLNLLGMAYIDQDLPAEYLELLSE